ERDLRRTRRRTSLPVITGCRYQRSFRSRYRASPGNERWGTPRGSRLQQSRGRLGGDAVSDVRGGAAGVDLPRERPWTRGQPGERHQELVPDEEECRAKGQTAPGTQPRKRATKTEVGQATGDAKDFVEPPAH